ncbi:hypothetical protein C0J52_04336 [Blattella germanica]|nr:hypothetical protein C0J52_04336 [Blattella germanica]
MSEENERDAGFCSGEDLEDPLEPEDDLHSPTDVSEDSVEVKVLPISLRNIKNKRKCAEPRKVPSEDDDVLPPYKKRRHFITEDTEKKPTPILQDDAPPRPSSVTSLPGVTTVTSSPTSPFRPWSQQSIPPPSTPQEAEQQAQQLIRRCPSTSISTPSPPPQSFTPSRLPHVPVPRRCHSASVTASSAPSTPDLPQPFNDRVPSLHQQEEPLSLVLKNGSSEGSKTPQRRDRRPPQSPIPPPEARIHPSEITHPNRLRIDLPGRYEDMRLYGMAGPMVRSMTPVDRYGIPHARIMHERQTMMQVNRPNACETIVRCPSTVSRPQQRFEAIDFTQGCSTSTTGKRTLSECEDKGDIEDLSSGLKHRTSSAKFSVDALLGGGREPKTRDEPKPGPSSIASSSSNPHGEQQKHKQTSPNGGQQRNYKNMTRERRIEANARERTRVHTISAAFDTLRRAIPAYSHNQKLSKLSVLRIACSYILTLSRVAGADYSADNSEPSLSDCVDLVSRTIQTEGKLRRKKDD